MKLKIVIAVALICWASTGKTLCLESKDTAAERCMLLIKNTSPSPIWLSHDNALKEKLSLDELEQSRAQAIQPYEVAPIQASNSFTIHTRSPQSNTQYQKNFTIIQRLCDPSNDEYAIDFSLFESGQADPKRFITINHLKEKETPESAYPLCPGGLLPVFDQETDQWFCKVYRHSDVYEKYVDEYVPVLSYIYQWLPSSIWIPWYIKHPQFYNWYHKNPDFYSHLPNYQAPWTTQEYAAWYKTQPEKVRQNFPEPEIQLPDMITQTLPVKNPIGLPEHKIKTKNTNTELKKIESVEQGITTHAKEHKKQVLEDVVSLHMTPEKNDTTIDAQEGKKSIEVAPEPPIQAQAKKLIKKPAAIVKQGAIITQYGKHKIIL